MIGRFLPTAASLRSPLKTRPKKDGLPSAPFPALSFEKGKLLSIKKHRAKRARAGTKPQTTQTKWKEKANQTDESPFGAVWFLLSLSRLWVCLVLSALAKEFERMWERKLRPKAPTLAIFSTLVPFSFVWFFFQPNHKRKDNETSVREKDASVGSFLPAIIAGHLSFLSSFTFRPNP